MYLYPQQAALSIHIKTKITILIKPPSHDGNILPSNTHKPNENIDNNNKHNGTNNIDHNQIP